MKFVSKIFYLALVAMTFLGCREIEMTEKVQDEKQAVNTVSSTDADVPLKIGGTAYVPIYSDIYSETKEIRFQLTATLSIRNTSPADTLFVSKVSYHNTAGETVRQYVKEPIFLKPLETLEYVIEQNDTEGGTGANFMIDWSANRNIKPLFQGVMIGIVGQQGFAFTTEGIEVETAQKE